MFIFLGIDLEVGRSAGTFKGGFKWKDSFLNLFPDPEEIVFGITCNSSED